MRFSPLILLAVPAIAQFDFATPASEGCVDPTAFTQCFDTLASNFVECGNFCRNGQNQLNLADCDLGCVRIRQKAQFGCWMGSCWNQVYTCAYQLAAISYMKSNGLLQSPGVVPYYPPPDGPVDGSCSCNLAYLYGNSTVPNEPGKCINAALQSHDQLAECECCQGSWRLSNMITGCPTTDLTNLAGTNDLIPQVQELLATRSNDNCSVLSTNPGICLSEGYAFPYANGSVINPFNLPNAEQPGSEPLSNHPGNAFTAAGAETTVLVMPGYTSTITFAQFQADAAAPTGAVSLDGVVSTGVGINLTESVTATGSSKGTATVTGAPAATSSSAAVGAREAGKVAVGGVVAAFALLNL